MVVMVDVLHVAWCWLGLELVRGKTELASDGDKLSNNAAGDGDGGGDVVAVGDQEVYA